MFDDQISTAGDTFSSFDDAFSIFGDAFSFVGDQISTAGDAFSIFGDWIWIVGDAFSIVHLPWKLQLPGGGCAGRVARGRSRASKTKCVPKCNLGTREAGALERGKK